MALDWHEKRDARDDKFVRLYLEQNKSLSEIGKLFGVFPSTVGRALKRRGVGLRGRGYPTGRPHKKRKAT